MLVDLKLFSQKHLFCDILHDDNYRDVLKLRCCDELERANNFGGSRRSVNSQGGRSVPPRVSCPLCPKNYSDKSSLKKHLKSCCKEHGKCFDTVCEVYLSTRFDVKMWKFLVLFTSIFY